MPWGLERGVSQSRAVRWAVVLSCFALVKLLADTIKAGGERGELAGRATLFVCAVVTTVFGLSQRRAELSADVQAVLNKYQLSIRGFLPEKCLQRLPKQWDNWEALAERLPELNKTKELRKVVDALPVIDPPRELAELRRACVVLGQLSHSYIHGGSVPWASVDEANGTEIEDTAGKPTVLPASLAVPWLKVNGALVRETPLLSQGMPMVLTAMLDLWNWRRPQGAAFSPAEMECISTQTGTRAEVMFHMLPCCMQCEAGAVIPKVFTADALLRDRTDRELCVLLGELKDVLVRFRELFSSVHKLVDMRTFYDIYRPLLGGFYPDGIVLAGVTKTMAEQYAPEQLENGLLKVERVGKKGKVVRTMAKGPSAGQSTMIILFDQFLGITHFNKEGGEAGPFQEEMYQYMPAPHRQMLHDFTEKLKASGTVRDYVEGNKPLHEGRPAPEKVKEAFNACLNAFRQFRAFHLGIATDYLIKTKKGTGASDFRGMLKECVDDTRMATCPGLNAAAAASASAK